MTKAEKIEKLKAAGLDDAAIEAMLSGDSESEIAALKAQITAAEAKASGINGDKKKYQAKADELQAKLDELEGKDLGEAGKLKLEVERMKSRLDATEKAKADLETNWKAEKRNGELSKVASKLKFLDTVPEDTRFLLVQNELKDIEDFGNTVVVDERLKSVRSKYAGLLASDAPSGAGSKSSGSASGSLSPTLESLKNTSYAEISKDPAAYLSAAIEASKGE